MKSLFALTAALILGLGIAAGGYLAGDGLVKSRLGDRSVSVKGLSEREVKADLALWALRFVVTGNDLAETQAEVKRNAEVVGNFLKSHGFSEEEIELQAPPGHRPPRPDVFERPVRHAFHHRPAARAALHRRRQGRCREPGTVARSSSKVLFYLTNMAPSGPPTCSPASPT